jgi:hypothetical protein
MLDVINDDLHVQHHFGVQCNAANVYVYRRFVITGSYRCFVRRFGNYRHDHGKREQLSEVGLSVNSESELTKRKTMHTLIAVITAAAAWAWIVANKLTIYYFYSAAVERMPPPDVTSGKAYTWVYSFLQVTAANTRRTQDAVAVVTTQKP